MVEFFYIVEDLGPESDVGEESLLEGEVGPLCLSSKDVPGGGSQGNPRKFLLSGWVMC